MIYLAPLKKWVVDVLKSRENSPNVSNTKMPFIVMTSGAKIVKMDSKGDTKEKVLQKVEDIVKNDNSGSVEYRGCILSNQINHSLNYSKGLTSIGYDFTGKLITVAEYGRNISQPIIESLEVNTDGTNNTLKTARVNVRCFSLKQLEMFELIYCKAGMHILIEYGDNSFAPVLNTVMIPKNDYNTFVSEFKSHTVPTTKQFGEYLNKCKISKGTYDRVAGKLINYSYGIEQDGTYLVNLEVAQSNEYNLALPKAFITKYSSFQTPNKNKPGIEQWKNKLLNELPGLKKSLIDGTNFNKKWENHFYNWGKSNETKLDEAASNEPYLSLHFILEVLMNNPSDEGGTAPEFTFEVPKFKIGGNQTPFIPISVTPNIISSTPITIFPNKNLPSFFIDDKTNEIKLSDKSIDGTINGLSIIDSQDIKFEFDGKDQLIEPKPGLVIGNALNIFVRYREIGEAWERNYKIGDFLVDILERVNESSYELFRLRVGNIKEDSNATVLDVLLTNTQAKLKTEKDDVRSEYRFKPTTIKSNVRDFKFNFELGDQVAAATIFNSSKFLAAVKYEKELNKKGKDGLSLPKGVYQSIDYSAFSTADGYFSINQIEYTQITSVKPDDLPADANKIKEEENKIKEDIKKSYETKTKKFKIKKGDIRTLVFEDKSFIVKQLKLNDTKIRNQYELVTPIKVNLTIDGISGITCGETFKIDGIPEQYNRLGSFQITNTKHIVNTQQGWTTEIEGEFRYGI